MKTISKILLVRAPYARLIVQGLKTWEMRSTATNIRERIGIAEVGSGLIIGEVDLVDCLGSDTNSILYSNLAKHRVFPLSLLWKWNVPWVLKNAVEYKEPKPYDHPRGAVIWVKVGEQ